MSREDRKPWNGRKAAELAAPELLIGRFGAPADLDALAIPDLTEQEAADFMAALEESRGD